MLRDTCAVRQLKRGEGLVRVLLRLGLSETTSEDAKMEYEQLSTGGISRSEGSPPHRAHETLLPLGDAHAPWGSVRH
jgi:hypothetical protein